jgi:hypothetical protein|tara:strand:+ start:834 stop:1415 length:582 start_codon:yes stop_codon:yes gene_type:complete
MRTFLTLFFFIIFIVNSKAQGIKITEDFESNTLGWTEVMDAKGQAIISEGVMQIESKGEEYWSTAWTDLDPSAPFEITVDVKVRRLDKNRTFGMIIDYLDSGQYILLLVKEGNARLIKMKEGKSYYHTQSIKLARGWKTDVKLAVKYEMGKLTFEVNGIFALEARYIEMTSSGVGLYVHGKQKLEFDNFTITQ